MKPPSVYITILILLLAAGITMAADETNSAVAQPVPATNGQSLDLSSFQSIVQHNIFDPNRRGYVARVTPTYVPVRIDSFALRGTAADDGQRIAVFVGNNSQYSKVATTKDTIAGYKIAEIGFDHVKLAAAGNRTFNLPVGSQMKRRDNGPWSLDNSLEPSADAATPATADKPDAATATHASNSDDDVIKRLMKKHQEDN